MFHILKTIWRNRNDFECLGWSYPYITLPQIGTVDYCAIYITTYIMLDRYESGILLTCIHYWHVRIQRDFYLLSSKMSCRQISWNIDTARYKFKVARSLWNPTISGLIMTSSNGNIFRVTGPLCGEFTGHRWIPLTKGQWHGALMFSLICALNKQLSKQSLSCWFGTPSRSLWRHCNGVA